MVFPSGILKISVANVEEGKTSKYLKTLNNELGLFC